MSNKICPSCNISMREIDLRTKYGVPLVIEQCETCGGLWFDDLELYLTKMGDSAIIDGVDLGKLRELAKTAPATLHCPNDKEILTRFKDASFPESLELDTCPKCQGFWLNRGEFSRFQEHRQAVIDKHTLKQAVVASQEISEADKKLGEELDKMMATASTGNYKSLGAFGTFLSQPINPLTNRPFGNSDTDGADRAKTALALVIMVIRLLIRLFAK